MIHVALCGDFGQASTRDGLMSIPGLCHDPSLLDAVPDEADRIVVGIHAGDVEMTRVQSAARRLGFDPLAVGVLELSSLTDAARLHIALAGLVARTLAFPGAAPEQIKLEAPRNLSRRAFLSRPVPLSIGAPAIDPGRCVAADGCSACVLACPASALTRRGAWIDYDKTACVACGICIATCPTGAVVNPTCTPAAIEAQIRAMVAASDSPVAVRYVCRTDRPLPVSGSFDVEVACTGMLTPGWLLGPLVMGAAGVGALVCSDSGCPIGHDARVQAAVTDARTILEGFGLPAGLVGSPEPNAAGPKVTDADAPVLGAGVDGRVIAALAARAGDRPDRWVALTSTQVGSVHIDPEACTTCAMCAQTCPTSALSSSDIDGSVVIDFDSGACVACGECLSTCPESERGAISLDVGFDLADWAVGRRELRRDITRRCERCGDPIAPGSMLDRIAGLLGTENEAALGVLTTRCLRCR